MPRWKIRSAVITATQFWPIAKPWPAGVCEAVGNYFLIAPLGLFGEPHKDGKVLRAVALRPGDWVVFSPRGRFVCPREHFDFIYHVDSTVLSAESPSDDNQTAAPSAPLQTGAEGSDDDDT